MPANSVKHIDLSRWTGDSSENGTDECAVDLTDDTLVEQKEEKGKADTGQDAKREKEVAESKPKRPEEPAPAESSRSCPRRKGVRETEANRYRGGKGEDV